jgi:hypothetical protein
LLSYVGVFCSNRIQGALEKEQAAVADVQRQLASMRAELASPMSSSLSKAEQQQLGELGPAIQQLTSQLAAARAAKRKVSGSHWFGVPWCLRRADS